MTQALDPRDLVAELLADGWREGPPALLPAEVVIDDISTYRLLPCEACSAIGQLVTAYHRGPREYRILVQCRACGNCQM